MVSQVVQFFVLEFGYDFLLPLLLILLNCNFLFEPLLAILNEDRLLQLNIGPEPIHEELEECLGFGPRVAGAGALALPEGDDSQTIETINCFLRQLCYLGLYCWDACLGRYLWSLTLWVVSI